MSGNVPGCAGWASLFVAAVAATSPGVLAADTVIAAPPPEVGFVDNLLADPSFEGSGASRSSLVPDTVTGWAGAFVLTHDPLEVIAAPMRSDVLQNAPFFVNMQHQFRVRWRSF